MRLVLLFIAVCLLWIATLAFCGCADIVIGDSPIVAIGDTVYVFALEDDSVLVSYYSCDWWEGIFIDVYREIEEGMVVHFEDDFDDMKLCIVSIASKLYTIPILSCGDDDECYISFDFGWNEWGVRGETE